MCARNGGCKHKIGRLSSLARKNPYPEPSEQLPARTHSYDGPEGGAVITHVECEARGGIRTSLINIWSFRAFPRKRRIVSLGYMSRAEVRMLSATDFSNRTMPIIAQNHVPEGGISWVG